jgi:hypothetical protein
MSIDGQLSFVLKAGFWHLLRLDFDKLSSYQNEPG